jgi:hypothetical protein
MSMTTSTKFKMRDKAGNSVEVPFEALDYMRAGEANLTLSQYLTQKYGGDTDETKYGSVIGQFMASAGMFMGEDYTTGIKPPTMKAVMSEGIQISAITRNDGSDQSPSGRMLFPEIIMRTIESELRESQDDFLGGWEKMIAQTSSINGPKFEQPIINVKAPEGQAANPIAQLAEPDALVSISVSEVSRTITTKSIGLIISDQALQATTLDLVSIILSAHARGERVRTVEEHINGIVSGDVDRNMSALPTFQAKTLDALVTDISTVSHKAWIKYLRSNYRKMSINRIITTLDTAMAIEARSLKPTRDTVFFGEGNFPIDMTVDNLSINAPPVLIVDDGVIPADTIVGLDSRYAIRRVINAQASYSAIEQYLMRRASAFRIDYGEFSHRLYDDAFSVMELTVA